MAESSIGLESAPSLFSSNDSLQPFNSLKLSLRCEGMPKLITMYKDLIINGVSGCQLLPFLCDVLKPDERSLIQRLHDRNGTQKATKQLLNILDRKKGFPDKWERFVEALKKADYKFVAKALSGEEINEDVYNQQYNLLTVFGEDVITTLKPLDILFYIKQKGIINEQDYQEIEAENRNKGNIAATLVLFERLGQCKCENWLRKFLNILCETNYQQLVETIDPDHINNLERQKHQDGDFSTESGEDFSLEKSSSQSIREDYLSGRGGAQVSINDLSPAPPFPDELDLATASLSEGLIGTEDEDEITRVKEAAQREWNSCNMAGVNERDPKQRYIGRGKLILKSVTDDDKEMKRMNSMDGLCSMNVNKLMESLDREVESATNTPNILGTVPQMVESNYDNNSQNRDPESSDDEPDVSEELNLRSYQEELAAPALEDKNCIIVAPTGSGKTHVAMKIIQEHRRKIRRIRTPKVVFLVEQSALAEQQAKQCMKYLGCTVKLITGETQRVEKLKTFSSWLQSKDILVVTAQILVNALAEKDVTIQQFSLMIFDECHHAHAKHSYNKIMFHYMDLKFSQETVVHSLPQIVGLTASVGVGKADTLDKATKWIKTMMANMDAEELASVVNNKLELAEHVNIPQQVTRKAAGRRKNNFGEIIGKIMDATVRYMKNSEYHELMPANAFKPPVEKGSDQFTQWVSNLWREQAKIYDQTARRYFHTCRVYLDIYNRALIVYNDARASDSLAFIEGEIQKLQETKADQTDEKMRILYNKSKTLLKHCADDPNHDNPKLLELQKMIIEAYRDKPDSRGIVFVKTRELSKAIETWMKETEGLKQLKPVQFVGAQASKDSGGMTKVAQDNALTLFREGGHKLIIATSVAEEGLDIQKCNLIIRYDHVTNEIAMVQSRGRGRAEDSKYVVLAEENGKTAEKEELNKMREVMMNEAIKVVRCQFKKSKATFMREIEDIQKATKAERDLAAANVHGRAVHQGDYVLRCVKCSNFVCMAKDVKKIQNAHHAAICSDIKERVEARRVPVPTFQDENLTCGAGRLICKECGSILGNVSIYKKAQFPILKVENLMIEDSVGNRDVKKKWKSVPFVVPVLTTEDLIEQSKKENLIQF